MSGDIPLVAAVFVAVSFAGAGVSQAQYVRVVAKAADIRVGPVPTSELVTRAENGETFQLKGTKGDWFEISMFSGEYRYIQRSQAQTTAQAPPLPADSTVRRSACVEIVKAQDRAVSEAEGRFPTDFARQIDLERLLYDRYELPIFRKYRIAPARNATLVVECAKNRWLK